LTKGGGKYIPNPSSETNCTFTRGVFNKKMSASWSLISGDAENYCPNAYFMIENLITDGAISFPANPCLIGGDKTFWSKDACVGYSEYNNIDKAAVQDWYFYSWDPLKFVEPNFWESSVVNLINPSGGRYFSPFRLIDMDKQYAYVYRNGSLVYGEYFPSYSTRKYPYVCGNDNKLFRDSDIIVPNMMLKYFTTPRSIVWGHKLCQLLSKIKGCSDPVNYNGGKKFC